MATKRRKEFRFNKPETRRKPDAARAQVTDRQGTARAMAWPRIHPRLTTRSAWIDHDCELEPVGLRALKRSERAAVSVDEQLRGVLDPGDWIGVYAAPRRLRAVRPGRMDSYGLLAEPLGLLKEGLKQVCLRAPSKAAGAKARRLRGERSC
ncbi:putative protein OS=Streptomyces aurantiogriseus OX=66870 GN=GCM10010251_27440 PE=4 SV=1 [Streptomyces aurantiogriseus]|uniref:Uncharacterized protein n=1 Tax=Streptomyces aurantiogriseus TaxID=66870 RepID=A0A918C7Q9_9ACTN|nr:hypothetical protein GCM10010251_27440 [Streptomyces aurantiogriseus]